MNTSRRKKVLFIFSGLLVTVTAVFAAFFFLRDPYKKHTFVDELRQFTITFEYNDAFKVMDRPSVLSELGRYGSVEAGVLLLCEGSADNIMFIYKQTPKLYEYFEHTEIVDEFYGDNGREVYFGRRKEYRKHDREYLVLFEKEKDKENAYYAARIRFNDEEIYQKYKDDIIKTLKSVEFKNRG